MIPEIKLILLIAGAVYLLIVGAAIIGLLIATIRTLLQNTLTAVRRCARQHSDGGKKSVSNPRRNHE